jgi:hypothetical protein
MKTGKNFSCMDEPSKVAGITYSECGSLISGAVIGSAFIGTFGALILAAGSFLAMRLFLMKNHKCIIQKIIYFNLPLIGNYGVLKKCWKRFYI